MTFKNRFVQFVLIELAFALAGLLVDLFQLQIFKSVTASDVTLIFCMISLVAALVCVCIKKIRWYWYLPIAAFCGPILSSFIISEEPFFNKEETAVNDVREYVEEYGPGCGKTRTTEYLWISQPERLGKDQYRVLATDMETSEKYVFLVSVLSRESHYVTDTYNFEKGDWNPRYISAIKKYLDVEEVSDEELRENRDAYFAIARNKEIARLRSEVVRGFELYLDGGNKSHAVIKIKSPEYTLHNPRVFLMDADTYSYSIGYSSKVIPQGRDVELRINFNNIMPRSFFYIVGFDELGDDAFVSQYLEDHDIMIELSSKQYSPVSMQYLQGAITGIQANENLSQKEKEDMLKEAKEGLKAELLWLYSYELLYDTEKLQGVLETIKNKNLYE